MQSQLTGTGLGGLPAANNGNEELFMLSKIKNYNVLNLRKHFLSKYRKSSGMTIIKRFEKKGCH